MNRKDAEMPGAWICDKCKFILQKNTLHARDGSVSANTSPINERCPNDGTLMRPYTWREANEGLYESWIKCRTALRQVKLTALTTMNGPAGLAHIVRICIDAGIAEQLDDLKGS